MNRLTETEYETALVQVAAIRGLLEGDNPWEVWVDSWGVKHSVADTLADLKGEIERRKPEPMGNGDETKANLV